MAVKIIFQQVIMEYLADTITGATGFSFSINSGNLIITQE